MKEDDSNEQRKHIIPTRVIGVVAIGAGLVLGGLGAILAAGGFATGAQESPSEEANEETAQNKRKRWRKPATVRPYAMFPETESALDSYEVAIV